MQSHPLLSKTPLQLGGSQVTRSGQWEYCSRSSNDTRVPFILLKSWKDLEGGGQLGRDHLGGVLLCDPGVTTHLPLGDLGLLM